METNEYDKQADDFLKRWNIRFSYDLLGSVNKWGMQRCAYSCTFKRANKSGTKEMQIDFFGSNADYTAHKTEITAYDVLSCLSGEWHWRTADEIVSEFGDTSGFSVDALLAEARKLRKFFTPKMLEELDEIQ